MRDDVPSLANFLVQVRAKRLAIRENRERLRAAREAALAKTFARYPGLGDRLVRWDRFEFESDDA
jgi:hypothetical protein